LNETNSQELETLHAAVFRYAYRMLGGWEEAQDVTQEAFTRWAERRTRLVGADAHRRWLFVVARNLAYSQLRNRTRENNAVANPAQTESVLERHAQAETAEIVARAVQALPAELREVVVLREYESMTYDEIARITETALGTVKSRLARARVLLRQKLEVLLEVKS